MATDYAARIATFEFKKDPENDMWIGPDGCHYDTQSEAMFHSLNCGCGCGNPGGIHKFVIECLTQFERPVSKHKSAPGIKGIKELILKHPDIAADFVGHVLNAENLLEHGGGVHGSWLTARGRQFISLGVHDEPYSY